MINLYTFSSFTQFDCPPSLHTAAYPFCWKQFRLTEIKNLKFYIEFGRQGCGAGSFRLPRTWRFHLESFMYHPETTTHATIYGPWLLTQKPTPTATIKKVIEQIRTTFDVIKVYRSTIPKTEKQPNSSMIDINRRAQSRATSYYWVKSLK